MPPRKKRPVKKFVVAVEDFGAKGDGFTPDGPAFQAAKRTRALKIKMKRGKTYRVDKDVELDHRFTTV